jgi:phage gp45-like
MNRNSLLEMSGRVMHMAMRFTLNKGNDDPMMQELHLDGMNSDGRNKVERMQSFGFTSTPLPRDEEEKKDGQQQQSGGQSNGTESPKGPAAEGICLFLGGQRNHPVCIGIDDRRHRPMGLKAGENAQYDDQGQMTLLRRTGLYLLSMDDDGEGSAPGAVMLRDAEGRLTGKSQKQERMVSLRHVTKKKQQRGQVGKGDGNSGSQAAVQALADGAGAQTQSKSDYKHEGDSVNTEVRCTKSRIEFRCGDKVVGYYDAQSDKWYFTGKTILNEATEQVQDKAPKIDHN